MDKDILKSNVELVFSVLNSRKDHFLSVSEIMKILLEEYHTNMTIQTVINQLDKIKVINNFFEEKTERRGLKKVPTKVFTITKPNP